jgi:hypothetical protein
METFDRPPTAFPPDAGPSLPQRIWGVFVAPRAVFQSLDARPRLLGALLVLIVLNAVAGVLVTDVAMQAQLDRMQSQPNADPAKTAAMEGVMRVVLPLLSALGPLLYVFLLAAVFLFVTNILLGGSTTYRRLAAVEAHIGMIGIPMLLVRVPLVLSTQDMKVQTSLAAFLPRSDSATFLYQGLAQFEIFTLWMVGLTVVAVSVLGKLPTRKAAIGVIGAWLLWAIAWTPIATILERSGNG